MIYHIVTRAYWSTFDNQDLYYPTYFKEEGFIHCSTKEQVKKSVLKHFKGETDVLLLHLEESKITNELKYEAASNGKLYPHIYGGLNKSAVVQIEELDLGAL